MVALGLAPRSARADLTSGERIRRQVDRTVAGLDLAALDADQRQALLAHRVTLSLALLIPCYGSYTLDHKVFGDLRPAAILFDWVLGGIAPAGLAAVALADRGLSSGLRTGLGWTAAGLYVASRAGVLIIGNRHISDYNDAMRVRLGLLAGGPASGGGLAVTAVGRW